MRAALCVTALLATAVAVDRSNFRKCSDTSFCRRHRGKTPEDTYRVAQSSIAEAADNTVTALLESHPGRSTPLRLHAGFFRGAFRVRVTESVGEPRWEVPDVLVSSEEAYSPARVSQGEGSVSMELESATGGSTKAVINLDPFRVHVFKDGAPVLSANAGDLFHFEQRRERAAAQSAGNADAGEEEDGGSSEEKKIVDWGEDGKPIYEDGTVGEAPKATSATADQNEDDDGAWEESFGGHRDSKPHGPTAVAMDVRFPGVQHVFGIPEHAAAFNLKSTDGSAGAFSEPYRLYNLDVFEYELDEPMALYGSIPFLVGHSHTHTAAAFWLNPSETFVDVSRDGEGTSSHWISESGVVDLFLLPGPTPRDVYAQYSALTGTTVLPPRFALAYHQCRWNYKDEKDVAEVDSKFEEHDFPYDVLWLDIEHTDGKRYFTWDKHAFPTPARMQEDLASRGRKMVTIVDPHIKRDSGYAVHSEAERLGYYVKKQDGGDFEGWCWPGSSSYLDFTDPEVRAWWADRFLPEHYVGSTDSLYTWNDMNEPSVFNGPEVSMQKDIKSRSGVEHREWHNLYGFYQQMATAEGHVRRSKGQKGRSFVLSRAFFAGSQRYGAIWTGDNAAQWSHLRASVPMLLSVSAAGLPFAGADVGGFFGNPETELMIRWYQAGAYTPFFRAHAHIEAKRREPWLLGDQGLELTRQAVMERYSLLPLWYTLFAESHRNGMPVMRPMWVEFPSDEASFALDDQFMVGGALLVKPVGEAGQTTTQVYLPAGYWYDVKDGSKWSGATTVSVATPLEKTPVFQRGGSIVPRQTRLRRCSKMMAADPYTLVVALDEAGKAEGELYMDDGETQDYQRGHYRLRRFSFADRVLRCSAAAPAKQFASGNTVERVVIYGLASAPREAKVTDSKGASTTVPVLWDDASSTATVRKPDVPVAYDFTIEILS